MDTCTFACRNRTWLGVFEIAFGAVTIALNAGDLATPGHRRFTFLPVVADKAIAGAFLAFGVALVIYGVWLVVHNLRSSRGITLMPDRLVVPSGFNQATAEFPFDSIRSVRVTSVFWQKYLSVGLERGTLSIKDYLLSGKASFQDLVESLTDRVNSTRAASGQMPLAPT